MSAIWPYRCTGMSTRVRSVTALGTDAGSTLKSSARMSANRAVAPASRIALSVATNVKGLVMTSSPGSQVEHLEGGDERRWCRC